MLIAIEATKDFRLEKIHIVLGYFHGHLDENETIYIELPYKYLLNSKACVILYNVTYYSLKQVA